MELSIEHVPTIAVVSTSGASESEQENLLTDAVEKLLDEGFQNVVIDLTSAVSIDTDTLADIFAALRRASERSATLVVVNPHGPSGPSTIFDVYHSRTDAVEALMLKAAQGKIKAETNRIATEKSRRAEILLRLAYALMLIGGLMLLTAILS